MGEETMHNNQEIHERAAALKAEYEAAGAAVKVTAAKLEKLTAEAITANRTWNETQDIFNAQLHAHQQLAARISKARRASVRAKQLESAA